MKIRFRFEKLTVWQEARKLNRQVYALARKFPETERFGVTSQLRRAVVSVSANIAEGSGRNSDKDFAHFLELSYASLMETASLFYLALDECFLKAEELDPVLDKLEQLGKQIAALNRSLVFSGSKTPFPRTTVARPPALVSRPSTLDS
jgi:four helix bundle protein